MFLGWLFGVGCLRIGSNVCVSMCFCFFGLLSFVAYVELLVFVLF